MPEKVFICSTCYDLIDLRSELEAFFREAGMIPILSDSSNSEFQTHPDLNSVSTCLVNVRDCEHFVIVLSRRYGPRLGRAGFPDDVSATHLEYREAIKSGRKVSFFVRDRLQSDFDLWKANGRKPDLATLWCGKNDFGLFDLIEEHTALANDNKNNWSSHFRNSVELKQILANRFKEVSSRTILERIRQSGRMPLLMLDCTIGGGHLNKVEMRMLLSNVGTSVAITPVLSIDGRDVFKDLPSLGPGASTERRDHFFPSTIWAA